MTPAQARRQGSRDDQTGRYAEHHSCELCGRPAGEHYFSDNRCNSTGQGVVLDVRCATILALLPDAAYVDVLTLAATMPRTARAALRKRLLDAERDSRAGCVDLHFCEHGTGPLVGVYRSAESGIESDPETPWTVVCEEHHTCVCVESRRAAMSTAATTRNFCDDCRDTKNDGVLK